MPNFKKGFAPVLIVLVLAGLLAVSFIAYKKLYPSQKPLQTTPSTQRSLATPDPTANWKIYTNSKIGFELKYPERYSQPELPSGGFNNSPIYATGNDDNTDIIFGQSSKDSIDLIVFPFTGTIDELKNYTKSPIILSLYENTSLIKNVQVGRATARWYRATPQIVYPEDPNVGAIRVYFVGKNHGFILNTTLDHNETEINQILSTFKFTN